MTTPPETSVPSRAPVASNALLSAALGGLLCLTASCESTPSSGGDASAAADVRVTVDAPAANDVPAATDVAARPDVPAAPDVQAAPDAQTAADVPAAPDAQTAADAAVAPDVQLPPDVAVAPDVQLPPDVPAAIDAGARLDAAVGDAPFVCDVQADRSISYRDAAPGMTLDAFSALCNQLGGFIEIHPHCGGANSCGGFSYDETIGVFTEHGCQGLNTCTGYTCVRR